VALQGASHDAACGHTVDHSDLAAQIADAWLVACASIATQMSRLAGMVLPLRASARETCFNNVDSAQPAVRDEAALLDSFAVSSVVARDIMAKTKAKARPATRRTKKPAAAPRSAKRPVPGWMDAGSGFELGIRDGTLVARKDGKDLRSVPKALKEGPLGERLASTLDFLEDHARSCLQTVETWILRSLPVPRGVLEQIFVDDTWRAILKDAWVVPVGAGALDREAGGFFRGVDPKKGIGVVDRGGETSWLAASTVLIPHPVLLDEIDDLRQMAVEIGAQQGVSQLFRETFARPATPPEDPMAIEAFANGKFGMLNGAIGLAKRLGYRVTGGAAVCRVLERGRMVEARYEIGDGDPMDSTTTGNLTWVDDKQRPIAVVDVPPIAFSEGMRMAGKIFAKRKLEKEDSDD
jgi:hypothetical protein